MSKYNTISTTSSTSAAQNSRSAYQIITSISKNLDSIEKPINAAISKLCVSCQAFNNFFLLQNDLETCIKNFSRKKIESYNTITYNRIQTVLSNVYNTFDQLPEEIRFSSAVFEGKIIITKTLKDMGKERLIPPQTIQTFCDRPSETASSRDALRPQEQRREYMIQRLMEPGSESRKNMYHPSVSRNNQSSSSSSICLWIDSKI